MARWRFPQNDGGERHGINASYEATFRGSRIPSLAREICQNSLDAARGDTVRIEFSLFNLPREKFPGLSEYEDLLSDCLAYWKHRGQKNELRAFQHALDVLNQPTIPFLRISDFNTTGVRQKNASEWENLIRSSGSSDKPDDANGSFGLGKAAPFACSDLMTLFYSTNTCDHEQMHQGVAHFATFKDKQGIEYQNVGYYCEGKNSPSDGELHLDPSFERHPDDYGTDIYIAGFSMTNSPDWANVLLASVVDHFLLSIFQKRLEVSVEGFLLNKNSLGDFVAEHADYIDQKSLYYNILTRTDVHHKEIDFAGLGPIELWITDNDPDANRHVSMIRKNGMKICEWNRFSSIPFAGICWLKSDELNKQLRPMENPEHTDWKPDYLRDDKEKKAGRKLLKALWKTIKAEILAVLSSGPQEEMDAVGAGMLLPDEVSVLPAGSQADNEASGQKENHGMTLTMERQIEPSVTPPGASDVPSEDDTDLGTPPDGKKPADEGEPDNTPTTPEEPEDGENEPGSSGEGDGSKKPPEDKPGTTKPQGNRRTAMYKPVYLTSLRSICLDPINGHYRLSALPMQNGINGEITIMISAETENFPANIQSATVNGQTVSSENGTIKGLTFQKGTPLIIEFTMPLEGYYSLEVRAYAAKA